MRNKVATPNRKEQGKMLLDVIIVLGVIVVFGFAAINQGGKGLANIKKNKEYHDTHTYGTPNEQLVGLPDPSNVGVTYYYNDGSVANLNPIELKINNDYNAQTLNHSNIRQIGGQGAASKIQAGWQATVSDAKDSFSNQIQSNYPHNILNNDKPKRCPIVTLPPNHPSGLMYVERCE